MSQMPAGTRGVVVMVRGDNPGSAMIAVATMQAKAVAPERRVCMIRSWRLRDRDRSDTARPADRSGYLVVQNCPVGQSTVQGGRARDS